MVTPSTNPRVFINIHVLSECPCLPQRQPCLPNSVLPLTLIPQSHSSHPFQGASLGRSKEGIKRIPWSSWTHSWKYPTALPFLPYSLDWWLFSACKVTHGADVATFPVSGYSWASGEGASHHISLPAITVIVQVNEFPMYQRSCFYIFSSSPSSFLLYSTASLSL